MMNNENDMQPLLYTNNEKKKHLPASRTCGHACSLFMLELLRTSRIKSTVAWHLFTRHI